MRFIIKNETNENLTTLTRKIGYVFQRQDELTGQSSIIRAFGRGGYPRFHIYLKIENENIIFNLHLDQKKPIYKGTSAHSGEYDGRIVEQETQRIKQILQK
ncbi:hypothetical protein ACFL11_01530 [Patescibacteria group bacterium]